MFFQKYCCTTHILEWFFFENKPPRPFETCLQILFQILAALRFLLWFWVTFWAGAQTMREPTKNIWVMLTRENLRATICPQNADLKPRGKRIWHVEWSQKQENKSMEFHEWLEHRVGFLSFVSLIFPLVFGTFGQRHDRKTSQWWFMSGWDIGLLFWVGYHRSQLKF